MTQLALTDLTTEDYMIYVSECQDVLNIYGFSIYNIGDPEYWARQQELYELTKSNCFLRTDPIPTFKGKIQYLQGLWYFRLNVCEKNCSNNGYCEFGTCYCDDGYYGKLCDSKTCPGTFCIYDDEFFSTSECVHCSGYGECNNSVCVCEAGYSGDDCSKQTCRDNCSFSGDCVEMYPVSQCDCDGKFGGDTCEAVLCLNNCNEPYGACNSTTGLCTCNEGFYGIDCSVVGLSHSVVLALAPLSCLLAFY